MNTNYTDIVAECSLESYRHKLIDKRLKTLALLQQLVLITIPVTG